MRKRTLLGLALVALALGVLIVGSAYLVRRHQMQRELDDVLAALDESEPGWRLEALATGHAPIPAEENAGTLILKLHGQLPAKWLVENPDAHWRELPPNEPLPPNEAVLFEPRMAQVADLLVEARRLADRPRGHYKITYTPDMISTLVPHLQPVREMAELLHQDAVWQAHHGKLGEALLSCRAGLNVARSIDDEPILISQLVRSACLRLTLHGLRRTLGSGEAPADSLRTVQDVLAQMDRHDSLVIGLRGERAGMHRMCTNLENGTISPRLVLSLAGTRGGSGFVLADKAQEMLIAASIPESHVWILQHYSDAIAASKLPAAEQDTRMQELQKEPGNAPPLAKLMTCAWTNCRKAFRRDRAHLRCAMVALAVERYRLKHDAWPADLAALAPHFLAAVPADPYTDAPLKYRRTPNGVVVYSVGPEHTLQGDFFDHAQPVDPAAIPAVNAEFEFRLWDIDARVH